jgi:hypothetical protein
MKKKIELEIDSIGGESPLTKEEEKRISDFLNKRKKKVHSKEHNTQQKRSTKATARTFANR